MYNHTISKISYENWIVSIYTWINYWLFNINTSLQDILDFIQSEFALTLEKFNENAINLGEYWIDIEISNRKNFIEIEKILLYIWNDLYNHISENYNRFYIKKEIKEWWFDYSKVIILFPIITIKKLLKWYELKIPYKKDLYTINIEENWNIISKILEKDLFV